MGASDRRKLWICRFAWTTQTRCPHTHSSDRKKRRKRLEDSFEEEENRNGRRLYTLISTVPGPSDGVHLSLHRRRLATRRRHCEIATAREAKIALKATHNSILHMIRSAAALATNQRLS